MPEIKALSPEDRATVAMWLSDHWSGDRHCPVCGHNDWNISEMIVQMIGWSPRGMTLGGPTFPVVPVICGNCSNTRLFSAVRMGLALPLVEETSEAQDVESK